MEWERSHHHLIKRWQCRSADHRLCIEQLVRHTCEEAEEFSILPTLRYIVSARFHDFPNEHGGRPSIELILNESTVLGGVIDDLLPANSAR